MMTQPELKELLEELYDRYNRPEFIEEDPISVPHRFTERADREIAGFLRRRLRGATGRRSCATATG